MLKNKVIRGRRLATMDRPIYERLTPARERDVGRVLAAARTRGELVAGGAGGFALAFKADALWVGTAIDGVNGPDGNLAATDAAVSRFQTGLEGSRAYTLAGRLSLRPSVEVGLRHDGGDAETGAGLDVGGGLVLADAATGLAVDVRMRTLLVHQAEGIPRAGRGRPAAWQTAPGLTRRSATGCRWGAASSGRRGSAAKPPPTGGTTGWATASARSAVRGRRSSSASMRSGGRTPWWELSVRILAGAPACAQRRRAPFVQGGRPPSPVHGRVNPPSAG